MFELSNEGDPILFLFCGHGGSDRNGSDTYIYTGQNVDGRLGWIMICFFLIICLVSMFFQSIFQAMICALVRGFLKRVKLIIFCTKPINS
jgi:hypothetical protein